MTICLLCQQETDTHLLGLCPACVSPTKEQPTSAPVATGHETPTTTSSKSPFKAIIHTYSRAQAIADGVLVDLSAPDELTGQPTELTKLCHQHYKWPIACTRTVWELIDRAINNPEAFNNLLGIVHDILWMSKKNVQAANHTTVLFTVIITGTGRKKYHQFKLVSGPGDNAEPVLTLMFPDED